MNLCISFMIFLTKEKIQSDYANCRIKKSLNYNDMQLQHKVNHDRYM